MKIQPCCGSEAFDVEGTIRVKYLVVVDLDSFQIEDMLDEERVSDVASSVVVTCCHCGKVQHHESLELL